MTDLHPWFVLLHLGGALVFVGALTFELQVLEARHERLDIATTRRIDTTVTARVNDFVRTVVLLVFASAWRAVRHVPRSRGFFSAASSRCSCGRLRWHLPYSACPSTWCMHAWRQDARMPSQSARCIVLALTIGFVALAEPMSNLQPFIQ